MNVRKYEPCSVKMGVNAFVYLKKKKKKDYRFRSTCTVRAG